MPRREGRHRAGARLFLFRGRARSRSAAKLFTRGEAPPHGGELRQFLELLLRTLTFCGSPCRTSNQHCVGDFEGISEVGSVGNDPAEPRVHVQRICEVEECVVRHTDREVGINTKTRRR